MRFTKLRDFLGSFSLQNIFHYSSMACYYTFIVAFMTKREYSSTQIGVILTVNSIIAIIAQPLWGYLCDKLHSVRKVYICLALILSVTVPFLTVIHRYEIHLIYIPLCIILFYCSFNTLLDAWIVQGVKSLPGKTYGSIRLWGSVGYMVVVSAMGFISDILGVESVFFFFSLFMLVNAVIAFSIRDEGVPQARAEEHSKNKPSIKLLLRNYQYMTFIVCMFVLHLPLTLKNGFFAPRIYLAGGTNVIFALCQAISALVEIPVFMLTSKLLTKYRPQNLLIFSMSLYLLHFILISLPIPPWLFMVVHTLNGLGFSIFIVSSISYVDALSPVEFKTSALTLATGIYGGASGIVGNILSGIVIDSIGIINSFWYGCILVALSILLFLVLLAIGKNKEEEIV